MLGKEMYFDDLASLDPELYKNLLFVKNYQGDFEDLGLTFVINEVN
jgi:ubiquitin-protein ligase E3 C